MVDNAKEVSFKAGARYAPSVPCYDIHHIRKVGLGGDDPQFPGSLMISPSSTSCPWTQRSGFHGVSVIPEV